MAVELTECYLCRVDYFERHKTQEEITVVGLWIEGDPVMSSGVWDVAQNCFTDMSNKERGMAKWNRGAIGKQSRKNKNRVVVALNRE